MPIALLIIDMDTENLGRFDTVTQGLYAGLLLHNVMQAKAELGDAGIILHATMLNIDGLSPDHPIYAVSTYAAKEKFISDLYSDRTPGQTPAINVQREMQSSFLAHTSATEFVTLKNTTSALTHSVRRFLKDQGITTVLLAGLFEGPPSSGRNMFCITDTALACRKAGFTTKILAEATNASFGTAQDLMASAHLFAREHNLPYDGSSRREGLTQYSIELTSINDIGTLVRQEHTSATHGTNANQLKKAEI